MASARLHNLDRREGPPEVKIVTTQDAAVRRENSPAKESSDPDSIIRTPPADRVPLARVVPPGNSEVRNGKVYRCPSSGTFSPPVRDRIAGAAVRRMVSAPQEHRTPTDMVKTRQDLWLEE